MEMCGETRDLGVIEAVCKAIMLLMERDVITVGDADYWMGWVDGLTWVLKMLRASGEGE